MLRSLYAGMSGVKNSQAQLDVISDNIANVNTTGFKSNRMTFADTLSETLSGARGTAGNFTGANPIQIGRGSKISSVDTNFKQGSIDATGIFTDVAISGKGFFVVTDGLNQYYTRAGGFQMTEDGYIMAQGGNYYVMGRTADENGRLRSTTALERISLPFGRKEPAKATNEVTVYCNLDKNASRREEWVSKNPFLVTDQFGKNKPALLSTDLAMIEGNDIMLGDQIEITGTDKFGNQILDENFKNHTFTYGQDGTTMGDFIDKLNLLFKSTNPIDGATLTLDSSGNLRFEANAAGENDFSIFLTSKSDVNNVASTNFSLATTSLTAIQNNMINQLNGGAANMAYQPGDRVDINVGGITQSFSFSSENHTLQDIVDFINNNFDGAKVALQQGDAGNQVRFVDSNIPPRTISFSNSSGSGANGLNGATQFTMTSMHTPASTSTDLRNLLNMSISEGKTIEISGRYPDGGNISGTFTYGPNADGTSVQDLLNTINKIFQPTATATLGPNGVITMTNDAAGESKTSLTLSSGSSVGFDISFQSDVFSSQNRLMTGNTVAGLTTSLNSLNSVSSTPYQVGDVINIFASQINGPTRNVSFTFGDRPEYD